MKSFREKFGPNPSGEVLRSAFNMNPEALRQAVDYLDRFAGEWVFDPKKIADSDEDLARGEIKQAADTLYKHPNGAELNTAFRSNLDEMAQGEKREGDSTILSLRSIFKEGKNVTEGDAHLVEYNTEQVIQEVVGDPAKPSLMTEALVMATGAKVLRDDFTEEGNKIGMRAYMGVLRNVYVYFSETVDIDEDGVLVRSLWAEPESSLRHLLSELSVADEVMWERTGIQFPDPEKVDTGQAIYYPSEKLTRETMMHVIRMYQAMNT